MTGVLYPRLLDRVAKDLYREHKRATTQELERSAAVEHRAAVFAATGGRRVTHAELHDLRRRIVAVAEQSGFPGGGRRVDVTGFDLEVARILHDRSGLVAAESAIRSIWAFMALVLLPDVSYWRYPDPPMDRVMGTDITRHVWGRLWWRAHLLAEPGASARHRLLGTFNESSFDQIFARRRSLGGSPVLVRALAETWPTIDGDGVNERDLLRDVLKRLLRVGAVVEFEALDAEEIRRQIAEAAAESLTVLRAQGS